MPDADIEFELSGVRSTWGTLELAGPGTLRLTSEALFVSASTDDMLFARYDEVRGGSWRTGEITIHGEPGHVIVESTRGLEHAWASLVERACPLPELARDHRLLGSRRGGAPDAQGRLLAPLLQARRRLEESPDLETRVELLDARALRERLVAALQSIAKDAYPASAPDRRGLEAELEEAMSPLFEGVDVMERYARTFRSAPDANRFMAWRDWVTAASRVFVLADTGWASAARLIPASVKP